MFWKNKPKAGVKSHHEHPVQLAGDPRRVSRNEARIAHLVASIANLKARLSTERDGGKIKVISAKIDTFERERIIRTAMKET